MREIKFRAWDKNHNRMVYPGVVVPAQGVYTDGDLVNNFEDEELMQYTGIKDKNGKEIYVGDILRYVEGDQSLSVIKWLEGDLCYDLVDLPSNSPHTGHNGIDGIRCSSYEVIGNIYEDTELVEAE
jgi:uncharacterized phage protein (TIGR01671 family)